MTKLVWAVAVVTENKPRTNEKRSVLLEEFEVFITKCGRNARKSKNRPWADLFQIIFKRSGDGRDLAEVLQAPFMGKYLEGFGREG